MVLLRVVGINAAARVWALVDTGADQTIIPRSMGEAIGCTYSSAESLPVGGFGGGLPVAPAMVTMEVSDGASTLQWTAGVGLADFPRPEDEVAILGRVGCLEHFIAAFDGPGNWLELTPRSSLVAETVVA